jgi:chemotaxis signal transduction protein
MVDVTEVVANRSVVGLQVDELRRAFDQSFAEAVHAAEDAGELILTIRAGSYTYAVRLSEIAGIHECPKIVPLPGMKSGCLGIVGLRGRLHAVFRLSTLIDQSSASSNPPWLLITQGQDAPTLAVDAIDGCVAARPDDFRDVEKTANGIGHVRALFVRDGATCGVLHVPSLVALATGDSRAAEANKP